jgi:hypothetical protein
MAAIVALVCLQIDVEQQVAEIVRALERAPQPQARALTAQLRELGPEAAAVVAARYVSEAARGGPAAPALGEAVAALDPRGAQPVLAAAVRNGELPVGARLGAAEMLARHNDRGWVDDVAGIMASRDVPMEARLRAADGLFRAGDGRAPAFAREAAAMPLGREDAARLDELLFSMGDARTLRERVRTGRDPELQRREVTLLSRLGSAASRAALLDLLNDETVAPEVRLAVAEALEQTATAQELLGALASLRSESPSLAPRVETLESRLMSIGDEPRVEVIDDPDPPAPPPGPVRLPPAPDPDEVVRTRINVACAVVAVGLLVLLVATRKR